MFAQTYVGSRACAACHAEIYRSFTKSAMGQSMSSPSALTLDQPVTVHNAGLDRYFGVFRKNGDWYRSEYALEGQARTFENIQKLDFVIGTGENGWTFLVRRDESLVEAPLSFYARPKKWDLHPALNQKTSASTVRSMRPALHAIAAARMRLREETDYGKPAFYELAVGCENCHGPGGQHVTGHKNSIVNPGKLQPRLAEEICMNCHQAGNARVLQPGKTYSDFRPGTPLRDTLAIFKLPQTGEADLLEHNAAMKASKCFRESDGKLSCLTCHNVHAAIEPARKAAFYRARCLTCHKQSELQATSHATDGYSGRTIAPAAICESATAQIAHSALTNHRIIAGPDKPLPRAIHHHASPTCPASSI